MKTILLVDDEDYLRDLVRAIIEDSECRVLEACNGIEALEMVRTENPDLVVLDWMMPEMTGIEVSMAMRKDPRTATVPIILLSGNDREACIKEGREAGVTAYMAKPFSPLELLTKVEEILAEVQVVGTEPPSTGATDGCPLAA
jgi:CheY-like chemotaxis protein